MRLFYLKNIKAIPRTKGRGGHMGDLSPQTERIEQVKLLIFLFIYT